MDRRARLPSDRTRLTGGALVAWGSLALSACVLDFGSLSNGGSASSGSTGSGGGGGAATSSTGSVGGGCPLLDCSCDGACPAGGCVPKVVATGSTLAGTPWAIAVAPSGALYWTNQHGDNLVGVVPGGVPEVLTASGSPTALAVAGDTLVWAAADGVHACTASSCATTGKLVHAASMSGSVQGVAFDGHTVAWTDRAQVNGGKALSCALGACGTPAVIIDGEVAPLGVALLGGSVFWADQGTGNANGNINFGLATGGSFSQVTASLNLPTGLAVDTTYVYWTESLASGRILRCPYGAGYCQNPTDAAASAGPLGHPLDLTLAGGRMYWSNADTGSILSCPTPGCGAAAPRVHASGRQGLRHVAVNATCLFWTDDTAGGSVLRVPR